MPQALTKYFGPIEYQQADVVQFRCGLPAFEQETRFLLMEPPESAPLIFLQSLTQSSLCFLTLPIMVIDPDYHLAVTHEDLQSLGLQPDRQPEIGPEVTCLAIVAVTENGPITANLLAPIVMSRGERRALQAIRIDTTYSHEHPLTAVRHACEENLCS